MPLSQFPKVPTCHMVHSALGRIRTQILRSGLLYWVPKKIRCEDARSDAAFGCAIGVVRAVCAALVSLAPEILHPIRLGRLGLVWWLSAQEDLGWVTLILGPFAYNSFLRGNVQTPCCVRGDGQVFVMSTAVLLRILGRLSGDYTWHRGEPPPPHSKAHPRRDFGFFN